MNNRDEKLYKKLKEFDVDVPEFPMKRSVISRLGNWLFAEVPFPAPSWGMTAKGTVLIQVLPIFIIVISGLSILF